LPSVKLDRRIPPKQSRYGGGTQKSKSQDDNQLQNSNPQKISRAIAMRIFNQ
jgi:hypothetical protein